MRPRSIVILGSVLAMMGPSPWVISGRDYRIAVGRYRLGFVEMNEYIYDWDTKSGMFQNSTFLDGGALGKVRVPVSARAGTIGLLTLAGLFAAWFAWGCIRRWKRYARRHRQSRGFAVGDATHVKS